MAHVIPEKINRDIQECIVELRKDFLESGIPINDDNTNLHRFCFKLEYLLQNGMKEHTNLLGTRKDYWDYFCRCLTTKRNEIHDGLKFVKSISELKTSLGKGRAFIRFCLMQRCLADSLQCCFMNTRVTSNWYHESSLLMNEAQLSFLVSTLYELNDIQFDLSPRGHDLDVSWPTFARKLFGTTSVWQPPSRSVSVSSLVSCTSQNEPTLTQQFTNEMKELKTEISSLENNIESLSEKLKCAEKKEGKWKLLASEKEKELLQLSSTLEEEKKLHKVNVNFLKEEMIKVKENWQLEKNELIEKLNNSVTTSLEHSNKLQEVISEYSCKEESYLRNCEELKEKILYLETENSKLLSQSIELEEELKKHKEIICQFETNTKEFEQIITELKNENKMFKIKIKEQDAIMESHFDVIQSKPFKDLAKKLHLTETTLITAQVEANNLQKSLEKSEELNKLTNKLVNTLEVENLNLREQISILENNGKASNSSELEKMNNELKDEMAIIRTELDNVIESKNKLEEDLKSTKNIPEKLLSMMEKIVNSPESNLEEIINAYEFEKVDYILKNKICSMLKLMQKFNINHVENMSDSAANVNLNIEEELINLCRKQSLKIEELQKEFDACVQETLKLNCQMCILKDTLHLNENKISYEHLQDECSYIKETEENESKIETNTIDDISSTNILLYEMNNNMNKLNKLTDKSQKLYHDLESFRDLNHRLISKVQEQERKLSGITQELETTQKLVTSLKLEHNKLQTTEAITRYELKEKRKLLSKLRTQLESTKEECNRMRKNYSDSEAEWQSLRDEFAKRHKQASEESGFVDDTKTIIDGENDNQDIILIAADSNISSSPIDIHISEETEIINCLENLTPSCEGAEGDVTETVKEEVIEKPKSRLERLEEEFQLVQKNIMQNVSRSAHLEQRVRCLRTKRHGNVTNNNLGENSSVLLQENSSCDSLDSREQKTVDDHDSLKIATNSSVQILGASPISDGIHDTLEEIIVDVSNHSSEMSEDVEQNSMNVYDPSSESLCDLSDLDDENSTNQEFGLAVPSLRRRMLHTVVDRLKSERNKQECTENELRIQIESLKDSNYNLRREVEKLEQEKGELIAKEIDFRKRSEYIFRKERENFHDMNVEKCNLKREIAELTENLQKAIERVNQLEKENQETKEELKITQKLKEEEISALQFQLSTESLKYERAFKVEELQVSLSTRDEECTKINEDYKKILMELDKEKNDCNKYKTELTEIKAQKNQNETELTQLRSDNTELKKKVIKLIKEKDMLWKHSEKLAHQQKIQVTDRWMEDTETNMCLGCKVTFSLMIRKHHCRLCGRIFCHNCANHWLLTASSRREARVCSECYIQHLELQTESRSIIPSVTEDSEDEELDSSNFHSTHNQTMTSSDSIFDSENSAALTDTASISSLPITPRPSTVLISNTLPMYGSVPDLPSLCANKWSSHDNQLNAVKERSLQEEFDVISDEEIASSLSLCNPYIQASTPGRKVDSRLHTTITRNATDIKTAGSQGTKGELWVNAGTQYGVPIICDTVGDMLHWEFSTQPNRIAFSVAYNKSKGNFYDKLEMHPLLQTVHVDTSEQPNRGSVTMREPGVYLLTFDNRFSRVEAKKVKYSLTVKCVEDSDCKENVLP